jgi:DNA-binding LacI/PurR family transcriptional regulator
MDGVVLTGCSPLPVELLDSLRRRDIPTVLLGSRARRGVPGIDVDNVVASRQLARHLWELGHRRVAGVTLPLDAERTRAVTPELLEAATGDTAADRLRGLWEVFPQAPAVAAADSTVEQGERLGRLLLRAPDRPTAIVAQSDLLAVGVIRAAEALGLAVPGDLSVVGFDGIVLQTFTDHTLTTMRQPMQDKGRAAARAVLALIEGRRARSAKLDCEFVPGTTTAPPRHP